MSPKPLRLLYLGPPREGFEADLALGLHWVRRIEHRLTSPEDGALTGIDWIVSYGYRYRLPPAILDRWPHRIINLHLSYLPWNRGADPNLWSVLENTPAGVTIHEMDAGIDTGPMLMQARGPIFSYDTLRTSYATLDHTLRELMQYAWPFLLNHGLIPCPQQGAGSSHTSADKTPYLPLLTQGWDTPLRDLRGRALPTEDVGHVWA